MRKKIYFNTVADYNRFNNHETLHPLVSMVDLSKADPRAGYHMFFDLYCITLKQTKCGDLRYGNHSYDYQEGTLVFFGPGQEVDVDVDEVYQPTGTALVFHPDLLLHTALGKRMGEFGFFSYNTREALHLSEKERKVISECLANIAYELHQGIDKHSKRVVTSTIELFLNYCTRFYDRQFITRDHTNKSVIEHFENLVNEYMGSDRPLHEGFPSVAYCAENLNFSANYFGDLIKKEMGITAQEFIQSKLIHLAKERLADSGSSISQLAYALGFKYPQHFTRLFKQKVGVSPNAYRQLNQN